MLIIAKKDGSWTLLMQEKVYLYIGESGKNSNNNNNSNKGNNRNKHN